MIQLNNYIQQAETIAVSGHIRPDGDCVGACIGMYNYIKDNYPDKQVQVYLESFSDSFQFLKGTEKVLCEPEDKMYDLFISLDCSDRERLGARAEMFDHAAQKLVIDHHITNQGFGDINYIEPKASSTCEILALLMDEEKISLAAAEALYMGIVHDTGVFKHSNTSCRTMCIAGKLLDKGVSSSFIIDETFYRKTFAQNKALGLALTKARLLAEGRIIASVITEEERSSLGLSPKDLDGIIDQMRITSGVEAAVFLYESEKGMFKVSMRSNDRVDVSRIASLYGGGGHIKAAGCSISGDSREIISRIAALAEEQL